MKRVSYPLDDQAKARIIGRDLTQPDDFSSGSDHSGRADDNDASSSLSELFYGFSFRDDGDSSSSSFPERDGGSDSERDPSKYGDAVSIFRNVDLIEPILMDEKDEFRNVLASHVLKALQVFYFAKSDKVMLRRNVMAFLRNCGYNAAVCKTKWEKSGGIAAGGYEFIDVVGKDDFTERYLVDLDFAAEFEIARPTESYRLVLRRLPRVFVGKSDDLKQILKTMSDAARSSLKTGGLHLPPWRKTRFMQNKWLGPYRRTSNAFPATFSSQSSLKRIFPAKRCAVGFNATVNDVSLLCPSTARTR